MPIMTVNSAGRMSAQRRQTKQNHLLKNMLSIISGNPQSPRYCTCTRNASTLEIGKVDVMVKFEAIAWVGGDAFPGRGTWR
jgi:hypothetical protein